MVRAFCVFGHDASHHAKNGRIRHGGRSRAGDAFRALAVDAFRKRGGHRETVPPLDTDGQSAVGPKSAALPPRTPVGARNGSGRTEAAEPR